jgi:hypothetical protein
MSLKIKVPGLGTTVTTLSTQVTCLFVNRHMEVINYSSITTKSYSSED